MAGRKGTKVGQAYVGLTVDGDGINDEIEDAVDGVDAKKSGKKAGKDYGDGMEQEISAAMERIERKLGDKLSRRLADRLREGLDKRLGDNQAGNLGTRLGDAIGDKLRIALESQMADFLDDVDEKLKKVSGNRGGGGGGRGGRTIYPPPDPDDAFWAMVNRMNRQVTDKRLRMEIAANEKINRDYIKRGESIIKFWDEVAKEKFRNDKQIEDALWKVRRTSAKAYMKYLSDLDKGRIDEQGNLLRRVSGNGDDGISRVSRLFGAGSRNNFLNTFGRSVGGLTGLFRKVQRAGESMFTTFSEGFNKASSSANFLQRTMGGFSAVGKSAFSSLSSAAPAALAGGAAVVALLQVLATVLSGLVALVTALAAAISSALVGSLVVLGATIGSVVAAGVLLTAMFTSLGDEQKKILSNSFKPVVEDFARLGQIMAQPLFKGGQNSAVVKWADNVRGALNLLIPVASQMGKAFATAGEILTKSLSGPGFRQFATSLAQYLPRITINLSNALGQFLNGLLGVFAAVMPYVAQFAAWLSDIAARFSNFANSVEGQNAISEWVGRALESLRSFMNFLGGVGAVLNKLLFSPEAQVAGQNIFDGLARGLRNFAAYLGEGNRLATWFAEGVQMAELLGSAIKTVARIFSALNNPGVITFLQVVFKLFEGLAGAIAYLGPVLMDLAPPIRAVGGLFQGLAYVVAGVVYSIAKSIAYLLQAFGGFTNALSKIPIAGRAFDGISDNINNAADEVHAFADEIWAIPTNASVDIYANTNPAEAQIKGFAGWINSIRARIMVTATTASSAALGAVTGGISMPSLPSLPTGAIGGSGSAPKKKKDPDALSKAQLRYYDRIAKKFIQNAPSIKATIKNALVKVNKEVANAIVDARSAGDAQAVKDGFDTTINSLKETAVSTVNSARDALSNAAQKLADATTKSGAKKALRELKKSQADLKAALLNQKRINEAANILAKQKIVTPAYVAQLVAGFKQSNATLADYAAAREILTKKIEDANDKLADAIRLRDDYKQSVFDSIQAFGALTTAVAKTLDGVEQVLTAKDITDNLQDRLTKIQKFQENLRVLLAEGLSNAAYKQIVDMGVEGGSTYAEALIAGGVGSVQTVNDLVSQIEKIAQSLSAETSDRLYQSGVDQAQALVSGLSSQAAALDAAAAALGNQVNNAVNRALAGKPYSIGTSIGSGIVSGLVSATPLVANAGTKMAQALVKSIRAELKIKSPSRVMIEDMDYVGSGIAIGLDNQHGRVANAASQLSSKIAMTPTAATFRSSTQQVSGNGDQRPIELTVITPTKDPVAAGHEAINELAGRLI